MDTKSFDEEITEAETDIAAVQGEMEAVFERFIEAAIAAAKASYDDAAASAIRKYPEVAKRAGPDGLAAVKRELEDLKARTADLVRERVGEGIDWPHRHSEPVKAEAASPHFSGYVYNPHKLDAHRAPGFLEEPWRGVLGAVGPILVSRELAERTDWRRQRGHGFVGDSYPYAIPWGKELYAEMRQVLGEYATLYERLERSRRRAAAARRARAQAEAADLWENA